MIPWFVWRQNQQTRYIIPVEAAIEETYLRPTTYLKVNTVGLHRSFSQPISHASQKNPSENKLILQCLSDVPRGVMVRLNFPDADSADLEMTMKKMMKASAPGGMHRTSYMLHLLLTSQSPRRALTHVCTWWNWHVQQRPWNWHTALGNWHSSGGIRYVLVCLFCIIIVIIIMIICSL